MIKRMIKKCKELKINQGAILSLFGLFLIFFMNCINLGGLGYKPDPNNIIWGILFNLLDTVGITIFALGIFNVIIETRDWAEYFEKRISKIIIKQDYLSSLETDILKNLQVNVMKALFKNPNIDKEGSFLNHFHNNLHKYISEPYREDVRTEIILMKEEADSFRIFDKITYICRKSGDSIQENIRYKPDKNEFLKFENFNILIKIPTDVLGEYKDENLVNEQEYKDKNPNDIAINKEIKKYKEKDGLIVIIESIYLIDKNRFQYWQMAHPTKNLSMTIKFCQDFDVQIKPFGINEDLCQITSGPGYFSLTHNGWMLPTSGLAFRFSKKENL